MERSLREDLESLITTAERVEVIEIEDDVRKTPSSTYFGELFIGLRILRPAEEISFFWRFLKK